MKVIPNPAQGRLLAGPALTPGAVLLGVVERDTGERGALVFLPAGYAQVNAGAIRALEQGAALRAHRVAVGLPTQRALAEEVGVSLDAVKSWELGRRPVPGWLPRYLARLAEARLMP